MTNQILTHVEVDRLMVQKNLNKTLFMKITLYCMKSAKNYVLVVIDIWLNDKMSQWIYCEWLRSY